MCWKLVGQYDDAMSTMEAKYMTTEEYPKKQFEFMNL